MSAEIITVVVSAISLMLAFGGAFAGMIHHSDKNTKELRIDMRDGFRKVDGELKAIRGEIKDEFTAVRSEMKAEFTAVRNEMKAEFTAVRGEIQSVRQDLTKEVHTTKEDLSKELTGAKLAIARLENSRDAQAALPH